jgi:hypothetical protein
MQAILSNPGLLIALCLIVAIVVGVNATLVSLLRRRPGPDEAGQWSRALGGPRAQQRQQSAQLDELHRIVAELAADQPAPEKPNE